MRQSFWLLLFGFLCGVFVRSVVFVPAWFLFALFVISFAVVFAGTVLAKRGWRSWYVLLAVAGCVLGVVRAEFSFQSFARGQVFQEGQVLEHVKGVVAVEPDVREDHAVLFIDVDIDVEEVVTRFRAVVPRHSGMRYGEQVYVSGTVEQPEPFTGDDGRMFQYDMFLMKSGVHYVLQNAEVVGTGEYAGNSFVRTLLSVKEWWLAGVARTIPEPAAALAGGVIVGAKQSLGETLLQQFRNVGLIHIVVLSGYNLTIVAVCIRFLLHRLSRRAALVGSIVSIVAFAVMVGLGATVLRASIMAIIGILALYVGNKSAVVRALGLAVLCMVCWNPFLLVFDVGFQLSVIATLGLVYGTPLVERWFWRVPAWGEMRTLLSATVATQIAVTPLLMYHVGAVSVVAPLANVLVLGMVPLAMLCGFLAGVVGGLVPGVGMVVAYPAYALFMYIIAVAEMLDAVPFAVVAVPPLPAWLAALLCVGLCVYAIHAPSKKERVFSGV